MFSSGKNLKLLLGGVSLFCLSLFGCNPPQPGIVVSYEEACSAQYDPDLVHNKQQRITVEGYLGLEGMFSMCSRGRCNLRLQSAPGAKSGILIDLKTGGGKNQISGLKKSFKANDIKVTTSSGTVLGVGQKIRVTGARIGKRTAASDSCGLYKVDLIEEPKRL